jgi:hypothetical protein
MCRELHSKDPPSKPNHRHKRGHGVGQKSSTYYTTATFQPLLDKALGAAAPSNATLILLANLRREALGEGNDNILELLLEILAESTLAVNGAQKLLLIGLEMSDKVRLPLQNLADWDRVEVTVDTGIDEGNHLVDSHWGVLLLLEQFGKTLTTGQSLLGGGIKIGAELGKCSNLTVLGQEELERTGNLLHGLELSGRSDTRHGKTDVDGRADTLVEEIGFQEDLAVGNGNDVSGNVGRHITALGLNDGQSSERATAKLVVHLGGTLEQTRVEIEDVSGISLTTGRTTQKKRHLTVSNSLLGKIVVDDESVLAIVPEPLAHGACREGGEVLQRSGFRGGGSNNDRVLERIVLLEGLDELGNGGTLLANGDVDAVKLLGLVVAVVPALLVENGVEGDGSLAGLTITNDKFTLSTSNGNHGIDGLETSLHGLIDRAARKNTGSLDLSTAPLLGVERTLAINGIAESIDDTAKELRTDWYIDLCRRLVSYPTDIKFFGGVLLTISPVRLTVSPSLTRRSDPKSTTPTWPASKFMHMPLTPEANLGLALA